MTIIAATGSRRFRPDAHQGIGRIVDEYIGQRDVTLMSGMAEGWDEYVARYARNNFIPLHAAIPNTGYGHYYWGRMSLSGEDRYEEFVELVAYAVASGDVTYVCDGIREKGMHANLIRNAFMVEHADAFMVLDPNMNGTLSRGTNHCFNLIIQSGKPFIVIGRDDAGNAVLIEER